MGPHDYDPDRLVAVLRGARELVARPGNDYAWSSWFGPADTLAELDTAIAAAANGAADPRSLGVLFAPTGPMQELALSSSWGQAFLDLAARFDSVVGEPAARGHIPCHRCARWATTIEIVGPEPRCEVRVTGTHTARLTPHRFEEILLLLQPPNAAALYALDPALVPCWCAGCGAAYCTAHWVAGSGAALRCPAGHSR